MAHRLQAGKANPTATRSRITSSEHLNASAASMCAFTEQDERMLESTPLPSAHMSILQRTDYRRRVGRERLMRCCPQRSAFFAAAMYRRIFMRVFAQKEKSIATESARLQCCCHSNTGEPGMFHIRLISS